VVAGLEPEHTNVMLQSLYKLAVSGDPSDPYVAKVLGGGGEVKVQKK
jgi:TRAF3-interacting protein 1